MEVGAGREEGEAAAAAAMEVAPVTRGCIRSTQGPWTVRRPGRGGVLTTSLRHPMPRERERRRLRARLGRQVAAKIYAGLRTGYTLSKHADRNDVLRALCAEAGYHVDDDGNVTRLQGVVDATGVGTTTEAQLVVSPTEPVPDLLTGPEGEPWIVSRPSPSIKTSFSPLEEWVQEMLVLSAAERNNTPDSA